MLKLLNKIRQNLVKVLFIQSSLKMDYYSNLSVQRAGAHRIHKAYTGKVHAFTNSKCLYYVLVIAA